MPAKKKYATEVERIEARKAYQRAYRATGKPKVWSKKFYEKHKHEEKYKEKAKEYQETYLNNLCPEKKEALKQGRSARKKERLKDDPRPSMLNDARRRAKQKGLEFSITVDDFEVPERCPVLGIPLFKGTVSRSPNSPSLDRVDNEKGYTKDNVHVISLRANALKNDGKLWELEQILNYMKSHGVVRKEQ